MKKLVVLQVKDFMVKEGFISVNKTIRENKSGYPFITFINSENEAENIYFTLAGSKQVSAGQEIIKGFFADYVVAFVKNAKGEKRIKLAPLGESKRLSMEDLF